MRKEKKLWGILALTLIFGLALFGCGGGDGGGGGLGEEPKLNDKVKVAQLEGSQTSLALLQEWFGDVANQYKDFQSTGEKLTVTATNGNGIIVNGSINSTGDLNLTFGPPSQPDLESEYLVRDHINGFLQTIQYKAIQTLDPSETGNTISILPVNTKFYVADFSVDEGILQSNYFSSLQRVDTEGATFNISNTGVVSGRVPYRKTFYIYADKEVTVKAASVNIPATSGFTRYIGDIPVIISGTLNTLDMTLDSGWNTVKVEETIVFGGNTEGNITAQVTASIEKGEAGMWVLFPIDAGVETPLEPNE